MNTLTTKALIVLLSVLILITIGSQIYFRINDRHKTEEAVLCDINENIPFKGVVVRGEKILESDVNGVYEYLYSNGSNFCSGLCQFQLLLFFPDRLYSLAQLLFRFLTGLSDCLLCFFCARLYGLFL